MTDTNKLLAERAKTHGEYSDHARCTQNIMRAMQVERNWDTLTDIQKESLHMFAHKMGRIVTGNPDIHDHWDDISGYAVLVSQRIPKPPADTETTAMNHHLTLENAKLVSVNERQPTLATNDEFNRIRNATVRSGSQAGKLWSDLYYAKQTPTTGRWVMIEEYVGEYGA